MIRALFLRWRNRHDVGLVLEAAKFGTKAPIATGYDYQKAITAKRASERRELATRALHAGRSDAARSTVTPIRQRGGR